MDQLFDEEDLIPCRWSEMPESPRLEYAEVHLWLAPLKMTTAGLFKKWETLSSEEKRRAGAFHLPGDRRDFLATRGILRDILSQYCKRPPASLRFTDGPFGRTILRPESDEEARLDFNFAPASGLTLFAFSSTRRVGIDLQEVRSSTPIEFPLERFFAKRVAAQIQLQSPERRPFSYFLAVTCREALGKIGANDTSDTLCDLPSTVHAADSLCGLGGVQSASLLPLQPAPGFVGALATDRHDVILKFWQWKEGRKPSTKWIAASMSNAQSFTESTRGPIRRGIVPHAHAHGDKSVQ